VIQDASTVRRIRGTHEEIFVFPTNPLMFFDHLGVNGVLDILNGFDGLVNFDIFPKADLEPFCQAAN